MFSHESLLTKAIRIGLVTALSSTAIAQNPASTSLQTRTQSGMQTGIQPRIRTVDDAVRVAIPGSRSPRARAEDDAGPVAPGMRIAGATLVFNRSDAQQAALEALLTAQQDPHSPLFHQWLTPDDFAARFGMADSDLALATSWLQSQGLTVDSIGRSRDRITFSGTAAQIAAAFQSELHYFNSGTETHFAPAAELTLPAALAGSVQAVTNLSDFRPKPHLRPNTVAAPRFTSGQSGGHFLQPGDIATIYDINAAYNAGFTGAGQSIAVLGQSAIIPSDITAFQTAAGLPARTPTMILQPGTGTSTLFSGDQGESDLDVEYSGAIAKGAGIYFVYVGSSNNYGVFDALTYAITNRIAPILSISYGSCETTLSQASFNSYTSVFQQAAAQGQTIVSSTGDSGSTDCYGFTSLTSTQRSALAVDFPSDSPYVTGLGGTEFSAANVAIGNTQYWTNNLPNDVAASALSYIPEQAWNDSSASNGLSSGGGGISALAPRPTWQNASVPGISAIPGNFRLVPDVSLSSSSINAGYLYCSSDTGSTSIQSSCASGFRDASGVYLTIAGGTSFAAPIFAGMVAILNQAKYPNGQGTINPTLYALASNPTTYASAFHDVTVGGNQCTAGATYCTAVGLSAYAATTGYDQATGLGSVDFNNLLTAWPTVAGTASSSAIVTLAAATTAPAAAAADAITITVARRSGTASTTPTGSVTLSVNGSVVATLPLVNGVATYSYSSASTGQAVLTAAYSGDSSYAATVSNTLLLTVGSTGTFTLTASSPSVTAGSTTTSTVTVTPLNGYTGTVAFTVTASPTFANACYTATNATVTGTAPVTTTISINTNQASCGTGIALRKFGTLQASSTPSLPLRSPIPVSLALASLVGIGFLGRRSRTVRGLVFAAALTFTGFAISGCGGGVVPNNLPTPPVPTTFAAVGNYTIVVQGTDTLNPTNTTYASFNLKVQ